jgi:hypothetical protein
MSFHSGFGHWGLIRNSGFWFLVLLSLSSRLRGQDLSPVPFYYSSGTTVEPQIATLVVGVNEDVGQAIVSGDRKYVTLDMDSSLMGSAAIRSFTYQKGGIGFVGSAPVTAPVSGGGMTPTIARTPDDIAVGESAGASWTLSILDRPGMVLIAPLER